MLWNKFKIFFSQKIIYWSLVLTLVLNIYIWYLIYKFIDFGREFHVIHYNAYFGIDLLASPLTLLNIPLIGIIILILNLILAYVFYIFKTEFKILSYFLVLVSFFINLELIIYLLGVIAVEY